MSRKGWLSMLDMEHSKEHSASLSSHLAMHNMAFKQAESLKQSEILILNSDCVTLEPDFVDPDSTSQIIVKKTCKCLLPSQRQ